MPFNHTISVHPKIVSLSSKGLVYAALANWRRLLIDMRACPTRINDLVGQRISDIGYVDALGISAGGVWMSTTSEYSNIVWRMEWPKIVSDRLISDKNPAGTITNSDLEMVGILVAWHG